MSLVIDLDDTPSQPMKSSVRKRCSEASTPLGQNPKRSRTCGINSYESPLINLGKTNPGNSGSTELDESVVILEDRTGSPTLDYSALFMGEKKQSVYPDTSVIVLSDSEEEIKDKIDVEQTSHGIILQGELSKGDSEPAVTTTLRKNTKRKKKQARFATSSVKTKNIANKVRLTAKRKCLTSEECSRTDVSELQPISIESDDENTIPNDDICKANSKSDITVEYSPGLETNRDASSSNNSQAAVDKNATNDGTNSHSKESSSRPTTTCGNISRGNSSAAEQLAMLSFLQLSSKSRRRKLFYIDTQGDAENFRRLKGISLKACEIQRSKKQLQNPNWASFVKNGSSDSSLVEDPSIPIIQPKANEIGSYCTKETDSSLVEDSSIPIIQPKANEIGSYCTKETDSSLVEDSSIPIIQPKANEIGSYYTKETIVKEPGSLRDIIIDGCNIAMGYTNSQSFSEAGLKLVIDYFILRGHTVKAFVPQYKRSRKYPLLEKLYNEGIVVFTPSRCIGRKKIVSHDDRFILDYATMCGGIVVSLDQYRDLYKEKLEWRETIAKRLLMPTFVGQCVMFPVDPLGKNGPNLDEFLRH